MAGQYKADHGQYTLIWRFIDNSLPFTLGVEAGRIYAALLNRPATLTVTVHAQNDEELLNLGRACKYRVVFEPVDEYHQWLRATFTAQ